MKNLRRILKLYIEMDPTFGLFLALNIFAGGLLPVANVIFPKLILDQLANKNTLYPIMAVIVIYVSILFVLGILIKYSRKNVDIRRQTLELKLNRILAHKAVKLPLEVSEKKSTLDLVEAARFGFYALFELFEKVLYDVGYSAISLIFISGIVVFYKPWLLLLVFVVNLLQIPLMRYTKKVEVEFDKKTAPYQRSYIYYSHIAYRHDMAKDLNLYGGTNLILSKAKPVMDQIVKTNHAYFTVRGVVEGIMGAMVEIQNIIIFTFLGLRLFAQKLTVGNFSLYFNSYRQLSSAIQTMLSGYNQILSINRRMSPLTDFLDLKEMQSESASEKKTYSDLAASLKKEQIWTFDNVTFKYPTGDKNVLDNCSFKINTGETVALVGRNGAGKSTVVKLICRFYKPQSGRILLNGVDINRIPLRAYYKMLAPTFQDFKLMPTQIQENIASLHHSRFLDRQKSTLKDVSQRIDIWDWMQSLEDKGATYLTQDLEKGGILASGGQTQKIALARSVFHGGSLIIMDEPTAALDPKSEEEIFSTMLGITNAVTSLFISHRLSSTRYADRILVMGTRGEIIEEGTHANLIKAQGEYAQMYRAQAEQYQLT